MRFATFLGGGAGSPTCATFDLHAAPLRWVSGGVVPIVKHQDRLWVVLFFREIKPRGWNLGNGSSQSSDEYTNIRKLLVREFLEEFIVLGSPPVPRNTQSAGVTGSCDCISVPRKMPEFYEEGTQLTDLESAASLVWREHEQLRKKHDGISIEWDDSSEGYVLKTIETPYRVQIVCPETKTPHKVPNALFTINPFEFGIEINKIMWFRLGETDYILDGEILETGPFLLRRPVILISLDFLKRKYDENGREVGLGKTLTHPGFPKCKSLGSIPAGEYRLFLRDIYFKNVRLASLISKSRGIRGLNAGEREECRALKSWLRNYQHLFLGDEYRYGDVPMDTIWHRILELENGEVSRDLKDSDPSTPYLTSLCPVTWKNLETILGNPSIWDEIQKI